MAIGLAILVVAAFASWCTWRHSVHQARTRKALLSDLGEVLNDVSETPLASGYVKLAGTYRGWPALVEPIVDTLSVRKLPALWLMVTVPAPVRIGATFDLMMRASGTEVFSRFHELPHRIEVPEDFPEWAGIRTEDPHALPPVGIVARYLQRFHEGTGKELLLTPKGLRMVVLADQADRGGYLIFREAQFQLTRVAPEALRSVLDDLHALREDLNGLAVAEADA